MSVDNTKARIAELESKRTSWFVHNDTMNFMRQLLTVFNSKRVLEIGTHVGYSALCFSLDAKKVVTIEKDSEFLRSARKNLSVANNITLLEGDAITILKTLQEKKELFDFIFIDAQKSEYKEYVMLSLQILSKNGGIFADNSISHKEKMQNLFEYLEEHSISHKELGIGDGLIMIAGKKDVRA